jgi:hypothetical protein
MKSKYVVSLSLVAMGLAIALGVTAASCAAALDN